MWHWFWNFGTGETGNNATHELDFSRWALDVKYPVKVTCNSGKNHFVDDPWTMYDTMDVTFEFENGKTITWDGKSRSGHPTYGSGRGIILYGSDGSMFVNRNGYKVYDRDGKLTSEKKAEFSEGSVGLGGGGGMTVLHVRNFIDAIQGKAAANANIINGAISTQLCHYANISSRLNDATLEIDPVTGRFTNPDVMNTLWSRSYERGWEPPSI
jgi:predicted dehydrogenase